MNDDPGSCQFNAKQMFEYFDKLMDQVDLKGDYRPEHDPMRRILEKQYEYHVYESTKESVKCVVRK